MAGGGAVSWEDLKNEAQLRLMTEVVMSWEQAEFDAIYGNNPDRPAPMSHEEAQTKAREHLRKEKQ